RPLASRWPSCFISAIRSRISSRQRCLISVVGFGHSSFRSLCTRASSTSGISPPPPSFRLLFIIFAPPSTVCSGQFVPSWPHLEVDRRRLCGVAGCVGRRHDGVVG